MPGSVTLGVVPSGSGLEGGLSVGRLGCLIVQDGLSLDEVFFVHQDLDPLALLEGREHPADIFEFQERLDTRSGQSSLCEFRFDFIHECRRCNVAIHGKTRPGEVKIRTCDNLVKSCDRCNAHRKRQSSVVVPATSSVVVMRSMVRPVLVRLKSELATT